MGKKTKDTSCRDCALCTRRGISKFGRKMIHVGSFGTTKVASKAYNSVKETCPVCGHPMAEHRYVEGRFQD